MEVHQGAFATARAPHSCGSLPAQRDFVRHVHLLGGSMSVSILCGDALETLRTLPDASVHCCITSPPYWGLRDYGCVGQFGLEKTPEEYVAKMVETFREVRRVLRDDGTLWLNLGDSYATGGRGTPFTEASAKQATSLGSYSGAILRGSAPPPGLKPKDLVGIPWRVAFALQADGWYLRQDIIWAKPNPMPESVRDRCTKAHEYVFMLSKEARYYYDAEAIKEPSITQDARPQEQIHGGEPRSWKGSKFSTGATGKRQLERAQSEESRAERPDSRTRGRFFTEVRNCRSVWTIPTRPLGGGIHFAVFPPELITPMILAGCPEGGTVLDPFAGSGTTGMVAENLGRNSILIELNPKYIELIKERTKQCGMQMK
jgi:DNA modification methylase